MSDFDIPEIVENPETFVKINNGEYDYQEIIKRSIRPAKAAYKPRKKTMPDVYKRTIIALSVILSLGVSAYLGAYVQKTNNDAKAIMNATGELGNIVINNTQYGDYNTEIGDVTWWYNLGSMAEEILSSNNGYDIDTKIYGCYINLNEYNKEKSMDDLMHRLKEIVSSNPDSYSDDVKSACQYDTFAEYIASKGLTKEEYLEMMRQVLIAHGKRSLEANKANELLMGINYPNDEMGGR